MKLLMMGDSGEVVVSSNCTEFNGARNCYKVSFPNVHYRLASAIGDCKALYE